MNNSAARNALLQYNKVEVQSGVENADPHRLVQMLMEGVLSKIASAKGYMQRGEAAEKGRYVSWAISIIEGLRASLDLETGGLIAENLDRLYDHMMRRLFEANIRNDPAILDEVYSLMGEIKRGWDAISAQPTAAGQKHPSLESAISPFQNAVTT